MLSRVKKFRRRLKLERSTTAATGAAKFRDSKDDNVPFEKPQLGNSRSYALRRLRELRPDLHGKVLANELSVNRAMIAAGFRKKESLPLERFGKIRAVD